MEYKIITPNDSEYPQKLIKRLGEKCPERIYYNDPLEFLNRFTMAVISADSITGQALNDTNQILFTIREYNETFKSFLRDRFYPPLHEFPEEDEYWRRAENNELLMLSISDPDEIRESVKLYKKSDLQQLSFIKNPTQTELDFEEHSKGIDS